MAAKTQKGEKVVEVVVVVAAARKFGAQKLAGSRSLQFNIHSASQPANRDYATKRQQETSISIKKRQ